MYFNQIYKNKGFRLSFGKETNFILKVDRYEKYRERRELRKGKLLQVARVGIGSLKSRT